MTSVVTKEDMEFQEVTKCLLAHALRHVVCEYNW